MIRNRFFRPLSLLSPRRSFSGRAGAFLFFTAAVHVSGAEPSAASINGKPIQASEPFLLLAGRDKEKSDAGKDKGKLETAFEIAVLDGKDAAALNAIKRGLALNAEMENHLSPLMLATRANRLKLAETLLEQGADVNFKTSQGETALMSAAECAGPDLMRLLLQKGADVNAKTKNGRTALLVAGVYNRSAAAKILVESRAEVNVAGMDGITPLIMTVIDAAAGKDTELVKLLLEKGAEVNRKDAAGRSPLQCAERLKNPEVIRLLKAAGAR